jgi:hypothetical protein
MSFQAVQHQANKVKVLGWAKLHHAALAKPSSSRQGSWQSHQGKLALAEDWRYGHLRLA